MVVDLCAGCDIECMPCSHCEGCKACCKCEWEVAAMPDTVWNQTYQLFPNYTLTTLPNGDTVFVANPQTPTYWRV